MRKLYETKFSPPKNRDVLESDKILIARQPAGKTSRKARDYQVEAYRAFEACFTEAERQNCFLISPTASGKSLVMVLMARAWITRGRKVIFVVPRNSIKGGFVSQDFFFEGEPVHWDCPINLPDGEDLLMDGAGEVMGLLDFLDAPALEGEESWICTYQTFIAVLDEPGALELFTKTAVILDEAHHLSSEGEDYNIRARNRGGAALAILLRRGIPHMLCTATPYRADGNSILPQIDQHRYIHFTRQRADHISDFEYVDGYKTCVAVGNVMELLEARLVEAKAAGHKVLVALPHVASHHAHRFARQLGLDHTNNDNKLEFERVILELCEKLGLSCASVVSEENFLRNDAWLRSAFIKLAREGSTAEDLACIPDVSLVQERYKEGTDCVAWTLCIQIGLSNSCVFLSQFPGRVLRDHLTKTGHTVEFYTLLPDYDTVVQEEKAQWTLDIIKSLLVLSFMDVDLRRRQFQFPEELADAATSAAKTGDDCGEPEPLGLEAILKTANPNDVESAFDRFVNGTCTTTDLSLLASSIPNLPEVPPQSFEHYAQRVPVNSSYLSDHEVLFRSVTDRMIAFASVVGKYDARAFRDRLVRSSPAHMDSEIERMYTDQRCSPQEIAAALQSETQYVRKHLLSKKLLRPQQMIRAKSPTKRKKLSGTI